TRVIVKCDMPMQANLATARLFAEGRRWHPETRRIVEMHKARVDVSHRRRQRCGEMIVKAVEFHRDDVLARRAKMEAGRLQDGRGEALRGAVHRVRCSESIDAHRPAESAAKAYAILQVGHRVGFDQRAKYFFSMLRLGRDDR